MAVTGVPDAEWLTRFALLFEVLLPLLAILTMTRLSLGFFRWPMMFFWWMMSLSCLSRSSFEVEPWLPRVNLSER